MNAKFNTDKINIDRYVQTVSSTKKKGQFLKIVAAFYIEYVYNCVSRTQRHERPQTVMLHVHSLCCHIRTVPNDDHKQWPKHVAATECTSVGRAGRRPCCADCVSIVITEHNVSGETSYPTKGKGKT